MWAIYGTGNFTFIFYILFLRSHKKNGENPKQLGILTHQRVCGLESLQGSDWLEVPSIYKVYFLGLNLREYPHNSYGQKYGTVLTYLHQLDPGDLPLTQG